MTDSHIRRLPGGDDACSLPPVIIGILSDTHGHYDTAARAMHALEAAGATHFIHCGDVGSESILDLFAGLQCSFVWGNCDYEREYLGRCAEEIGLGRGGELCRITLDGKQIAVTHGDNSNLVQGLLDEQSLDYLFTGHTHRPHDRTTGRTRWINPGALHRARPRTAATLDLATGELRSLTILE